VGSQPSDILACRLNDRAWCDTGTLHTFQN
jgi:hypothetical protein